MTENDLKLLGRQVGPKARTADMRMAKPRDCRFCVHALSLPYGVVCKITGLPIREPETGCHKFNERVNYE